METLSDDDITKVSKRFILCVYVGLYVYSDEVDDYIDVGLLDGMASQLARLTYLLVKTVPLILF